MKTCIKINNQIIKIIKLQEIIEKNQRENNIEIIKKFKNKN